MRLSHAVLLFLSLAAAGCTDDLATPGVPRAELVEIIKPIVRTHRQTFTYAGKLESLQDIELYARINGVLAERHFRDGQQVFAGDPLFTLDDRELRAATALAQAELEAAEAEVVVASGNLKRGRKLSESGYISHRDLDELQATWARTTGQLNAAKARLQAAQTRLSYATVTAPFSGRISDSRVDPGQVITASQTVLADLVSIDPIRVSFHIEETARAQVIGTKHTESKLEVVLTRAGTEYVHRGAITYVDNRVSPGSGTLKLQALFPNSAGELLPGEHVEVTLRHARAEPVMLLPHAALLSEPDGNYVFVVDDQQRAKRTAVSAGARLGGNVVIESGLSESAQVVVQGVQHVKDNASVRIGGSP